MLKLPSLEKSRFHHGCVFVSHHSLVRDTKLVVKLVATSCAASFKVCTIRAWRVAAAASFVVKLGLRCAASSKVWPANLKISAATTANWVSILELTARVKIREVLAEAEVGGSRSDERATEAASRGEDAYERRP